MGEDYKEVERGYQKGSLGSLNLGGSWEVGRKSKQRTVILNDQFSDSGLQSKEAECEELSPCGDGSNSVEKW